MSQMQQYICEIKQKYNSFKDNLTQQYSNAQQLVIYVKKAPIKNVMSAPAIWIVVFPTVLLDLTVTIYQTMCFPIYGIPKVKRSEYLIFDRQHLKYLNIIEKFNCFYCSYFTGIIVYIQEVAARTEQYWCPLKHARRINNPHSRYVKVMDYGDVEAYKQNKQEIRKNFDDLS
ncbi:MAG: hypothetical protein ABGX40_04460 [Methylococcales bacterium]